MVSSIEYGDNGVERLGVGWRGGGGVVVVEGWGVVGY